MFQRIAARQVRVGIVGLGYDGPPLLVAFARAGVASVGLGVDAGRVVAIPRGESYIADVPAAVDSGALSATADSSALADVDAVDISCRRRSARSGTPTCATSSPRSSGWPFA